MGLFLGGKEKAVQEYTLVLNPPDRRTRRAGLMVGTLTLNPTLLPDAQETETRFNALQELITRRRAETKAKPLPNDFPVFVAHVDSVAPAGKRPNVLQVTVKVNTMTYLTPGGRTTEIRDICGAVASHMIEGPDNFPPAEPPAREQGKAPLPYWDKGRLAPGAAPPRPLFTPEPPQG